MKSDCISKSTLATFVLCLGLQIEPVFAAMKIADGAPEGFDVLQAPHQTSVVLLYGGKTIGSFAAKFTDDMLQFEHPDNVVSSIPSVLNKDQLTTTLAQKLETHSNLVCHNRQTDSCGKLQVGTAGVIFDPDHLTAELFINKDLLTVSDQNAEKYLPLPERRVSSVYSFNGAVNGDTRSGTNYAVSNDAVVSYGEARFTTQSTASNEGVRFDTAAATVERQGWNATGGLFRSQAMQLLSDRDIAGVSLSTSTRTLLDQHRSDGNDIIVFLPRRSFVSLYREGRLYSSNPYEAGNQRIDTSALPEGAYTITLKIQEADGSTREEQRFFAKTQAIPPTGQPIYYVQGGVIRKPLIDDLTIPQLTNHPVLRAGTVRRIDDNMGLSVSLLGTQDRAAAETGLSWIYAGTQLNVTTLTSTRGDFGVQTSFLQTMGDFNASLDARKTWMSDTPIPGFDDMSNDTTQVSATVSYNVMPNLNVGARGSYALQKNMPVTTSIGPYSEWRIWQKGESTFGVSAAAARSDNHDEASVMAHFAYKFGDYGVNSNVGLDFGQHNNTPLGNVRVTHDDTTPGNTLLLGAGVNADDKNQTVNADADWRNRFGQVRGSAQESFGQNGPNTGYGGNFRFNAAQMADEFHIGGEDGEKSAVIVETTGDADANMKIFVNNIEQSFVKVGQKQVIYLSPFQNYNIRLAPEKSGLLDYDSAEHMVTLYPGNIVKQSWDVNKFYVVTAKIIDENAIPLQAATLKEGNTQNATDDTGRIQAELSAPKTMTFTIKNNQVCIVTLPSTAKETNGVLMYKEPLVCHAH